MYSRKHPHNLIILGLWVRFSASTLQRFFRANRCTAYQYMRVSSVCLSNQSLFPAFGCHGRVAATQHAVAVSVRLSLGARTCERTCYPAPSSSPCSVAHESPGVQTVAISVGVGTACTLYEPLVVLEALALTASITISLTLYTFWAARKGLTFQKWGPMLFTCAPLWSFSDSRLFAALATVCMTPALRAGSLPRTGARCVQLCALISLTPAF